MTTALEASLRLTTVVAMACVPAVIGPGSTYQGHKLLWVENGAALAYMPVPPEACARRDRFWDASQRLTSRLHVVAEFTVRADGAVDSVQIARSTDPAVTEAMVDYLRSCRYRPAVTTAGQPVATRVQWVIRIVRRR